MSKRKSVYVESTIGGHELVGEYVRHGYEDGHLRVQTTDAITLFNSEQWVLVVFRYADKEPESSTDSKE